MTKFIILRCRLLSSVTLLTLTCTVGIAQAKLVINGGIISITNGASLVIGNPDNTAITRTGSGYIQSEAAGNKVIWDIGPGNGNVYLLPWGNTANYFPVQFTATSGIGAGGRFVFSTYATPTWKNSDNLPPGVSNINSSAGDNSAKVIDRFWQITPVGYSNKPTLSNLVFTYVDAEHNVPNTITEGNLVAQRWNSSSLTWSDYLIPSVINTTSNTVTIASIPGNQLYDWWTLTDVPFSTTLVDFNAVASYPNVLTSWQTSAENNSDHFEVWRSRILFNFDSVGRVAARGNSNSLLNYSLTDNNPYNGVSYYRLKIVAADGSYRWSAIVIVSLDTKTNILLYPNPAGNYITITVNPGTALTNPVAQIYDSKGSLVRVFTITGVNQRVNISSLAAGAYHIRLLNKDKQQSRLSFIKQ
ncbi:MAG TPA: T9SS type A sorting domain-containing protein [Chryseolinea sp.]|nr:T9SS type A sorting domain-containing protein [Chryseolinea sp.]